MMVFLAVLVPLMLILFGFMVQLVGSEGLSCQNVSAVSLV